MNSAERDDRRSDMFPDPDESGVSLSSRPPARLVRDRLNHLLAGRFPHMHRLSKLSHHYYSLPQDEMIDGEPVSLFPSDVRVAEAFDWNLDLVSHFQKPALVIAPPHMLAEDLLEAHDDVFPASDMNPLVRARVSVDHADNNRWRPTVHHPYIVEGARMPMPPSTDYLSLPLDNRLALRHHYRSSREQGMTREIYALLAMQARVSGNPMDRSTFTILDGEPVISDRYFPIGHCRPNGRPTIDWVKADRVNSERGRFRRVFAAKKPIELETL